jgi:hypothetical protein
MIRSLRSSWLLAALLCACGGEPPNGIPKQSASPEVQKLVLAADPGEAIGVVDAKVAGPADKVVVVGRIADIVAGKVMFTLMDTELPYCGEKNPEDNCKTPWDYCCDKPKKTANSIIVEARSADGKPLATPALPDLRQVDKIKVTGKLTKDEYGNFTLVATGLFRVERPKLPDYVIWPQ